MTTPESEPITTQHTSYQPDLRDMIMLEPPFAVKVSPDGNRVAVIIRTTNWKDNRYEHVCQVFDLSESDTNPRMHKIHRQGSVQQVEWLANQTLAVLKQGPGEDEKGQVWLYENLVGDGWKVTDHKTGVEWFKPFAGGILYKALHPERDEKKPRTDRFGKYIHFEQEESASALYFVGLEELRKYQALVKAATEDEAKEIPLPVIELSRLLEEPLSIQLIVPSPVGDTIYLNCRRRDDLVYYKETVSYRFTLDPQAALAEYLQRERQKNAKEKVSSEKAQPEVEANIDNENKKDEEDLSYLGQIARLNLPRSASVSDISPDGEKLAIRYQSRDDKMYTRADLWLIDAQTAGHAPDAAAFLEGMQNLTASLDRDILDQQWVKGGIYISYVDDTHVHIGKLGGNEELSTLDLQEIYPGFGFHVSDAGRLALIGTNAESFLDIYIADLNSQANRPVVNRISNFGEKISNWDLGSIETIRWKSKDGVEIEGVLRKPSGFDPNKKYPLVFVVHGGPGWLSTEYLLSGEDLSYYPTVQFVNRDVLVLKPNYRGSIGRGQAFTELNVNNLGVGDLWDLESAIDHLAALGWVDPDRVGCMGWSQGGYISAYAGLKSDRFKAVSVGAGISDWYTYHISNDIPQFTTDYLSESPFRDRDIYNRTAPITGIANAKTPMLIQHGSEDRRVPLSNAMELYRGLKEMNVPVELFVYPGMGHPITKPRENHAVMHQNLTWFSHYLLGEELELE
jgi:dipeptidyl aminopeptidase/acylaminoacyl peptidase